MKLNMHENNFFTLWLQHSLQQQQSSWLQSARSLDVHMFYVLRTSTYVWGMTYMTQPKTSFFCQPSTHILEGPDGVVPCYTRPGIRVQRAPYLVHVRFIVTCSFID